MNCGRCNGCVVPEQISDPHGTTERFEAVRCLNCGNIQDAMIEVNRNHGIVRCLSSRVPRPPAPAVPCDRWVEPIWEALRGS
jgi:uncharacterized Zn finger protein